MQYKLWRCFILGALWIRRGFVGIACLFFCSLSLPAWGDLLAVAAGIAPCVKEIHQQYVEEGNPPLEMVLGPCGALARQPAAGAPFDMFLFSEARWPQWMVEKGLAEEVQTFAIHSLALWSTEESITSLEEALQHPMACPTPDTTAYGMLAKRMLQEKGLWNDLEENDMFIFVKSSPAAVLAVRSGGAVSAFVPLMSALSMQRERGGSVVSFADVTEDQVGGLFGGAGENARRFWEYVRSEPEIWNALGWGTLLEGRVEHLEGGTWFAWGDQRLLLPSQISPPGEARIFLPPHKIHLLDPHRPVEPELRGGVLRGILRDMAYLRGRCTLHVEVGGAVVDVDVPEEHCSRLALKEGMPVLLGVRPEAVVVMPQRRGLQKRIYENVNLVKGVVGEMKDSLACARDRMKEKIGERKDIEGNEVIVAEPLGVEDAIGDPSPYKDFPLLVGEEKLMEVRFRNGRGQAFTSCPARWQGTLEQVLNLPLQEERDRGLLIATLNALAADFGFADKTVHCKDGSPDLCGRAIAEHLVETFGRDHVVGIVGYQPAFVKRVAEVFGPERVRVTDLNPKNVGFQRFGVEIWHGERDLERLARESTLALVTGSALSNGSFDAVWDILKEHQVQAFCFGTTIAGIAALLDYPRFCFEAC
jgi:molybdenum ABC transporter molybdate-binding protein